MSFLANSIRKRYQDTLELSAQSEWLDSKLFCRVIEDLVYFAEHDLLIEMVKQRRDWSRFLPKMRLMLAESLSAIGEQQLALDILHGLLFQFPDHPDVLTRMGMVFGFQGRQPAALEVLNRALELAPVPMAFWLKARLRKQTATDNDVESISRALQRAPKQSLSEATLAYALFKSLDDLDQVDEAWNVLQVGMNAARQHIAFPRASYQRLLNALTEPESPAALHPIDLPKGCSLPIFVIGLHRSGTSLVESILGRSHEVFNHGETHRLSSAIHVAANSEDDLHCVRHLSQINAQSIADMFLAKARRRSNQFIMATEKLPTNAWMLGFVRHAMPYAKVIWVEREAMDVCFANLRELMVDGVGHSYDQTDMALVHRWHKQLMANWESKYPGWILRLSYEDLVQNPAEQIQRLYDFCGLSMAATPIGPTEKSVNTVTLSASQVREEIHRGRVGQWRRYAKYLAPLQQALAT